MKNGSTTLAWLVLATLVVFPGFATAEDPDPCNFKNGGTPEGCFEKAFSEFCGSFPVGGSVPPVCEKTEEEEFKAKRGLRWLALEERCVSPQDPDPACTTFDRVKDHEVVQPVVLVYDHSSRTWRAHGKLDQERIDRDVAGKPTVSLGRREELIVVVDNTNPLLYTLTAGAATEVDIPELVEVKKLAALLGSNIGSLVETLNAEREARPPGDPGTDIFMVLQKALLDLQKSSSKVSCSTAMITDQTSRAGHFIQRLELGGVAEYPIKLNPVECDDLATSDLEIQSDAAFESLSRQLRAAREPGDLCLPFLQAAERAFGGDFAKGDDIRKAVLDAEATAPTCTQEMKEVSDNLLRPLRAMRAALEQQPQPADLATQLRILAKPFLGETKKLVALITRYGEIHTGATTLLGKRDEVRKAASQVELFERRVRQHLLAGLQECSDRTLGQCVTAKSVSRRLVLANEFKPVRWDKIQNHSLVLEANAPLASVVVPSRPAKSEAPYSLDSITRDLWGIAASVVTTRIVEPTFTAVSDGAEDPTFTIKKTDKETRAGEVALLVDYGLGLALFQKAPTWVHGLGIEFGAGTDTDQPAFFGGISFRIGRFVRFGGGITYQQVTELEGQHEGQTVSSATDLRTRDDFTGKPYFSFSVALEAFSLFSGGDE